MELNAKAQFKQRLFRVKHLIAAATLAILGATGLVAQTEQTVDVTFRVRLNLGGDLSTLTTGINITCAHFWTRGEERIFSNNTIEVVPAGQVPIAPNGYIDAIVTIPDQPVGFNENPNVDEGAMSYACSAVRADKGYPDYDFVGTRQLPYTAISPADVGTCGEVRGNVAIDGTVTNTRAFCGTVRAGAP